VTSIHKELKQSKPFASKSQEAAVALLRTADLIRRNMAAILEPYDITAQQYNVLRILRGAGEKGLPTLEIVERLIEETPGITRLIDRLEEKQLVVRERCLTDRRQVFCRITKDGLKLLSKLDLPLNSNEEEFLGHLKKRELDLLVDLLDRAREGLNQQLIESRRKS
jgi:DNA-binding MarR family transcriptional regulator